VFRRLARKDGELADFAKNVVAGPGAGTVGRGRRAGADRPAEFDQPVILLP